MLALQVYFSWLSYEVLDLCRVLLPPVLPVESEGLVSSSAMSTILRQNPFLRTLRTDLMPCAPRIDTADTDMVALGCWAIQYTVQAPVALKQL